MQTRAKYKICRRLGSSVFEKCQTQKYAISEAKKTKKSDKRPKAKSDFGLQLLEKQRIRFTYNITERQFRKYVDESVAKKGASAADTLYDFLETRLDNVIYRTGMAVTRALARQMASHGHFLVNGKRTTVPSYRVRSGDVISVREGSRKSVLFSELEKRAKGTIVPNWISFDPAKMEATITGMPKNTESKLDFHTVLEFYAR